MSAITFEIDDLERWTGKYLANRYKYPKWSTRDGNKVAIHEMSDKHLENTIRLVERKDKDNEWLQVLECERIYRSVVPKLKRLKSELQHMSEVSDIVF